MPRPTRRSAPRRHRVGRRRAVRLAAFGAPVLVAAALVTSACAPSNTDAGSQGPAFAVASPTPNPTSKWAHRLRIVTVGDSLMSGYGLDLGDAWPTLLADKAHVTLTNLACGGMGFVVSGDCGTPYSGLVPALAALQPDIVIVQSSSNDFGEDPNDVRAETLTTVQEMRNAVPHAVIVGLSTIWNDDADVPDEVATTSEDLQSAISDVDGTFIDVGQPLQGHPTWMQDDDVHPTPRGQQAIEETVHAKLSDAHILH